MNLECNILEIFDKAKSVVREDTCMKIYYETEPLYIGMDASGVGLRAALLQKKKWYKLLQGQSTRQQHTHTHCICEQEPVKCGKNIQQHREALDSIIPSLLLCERGEYKYRSQSTSHNIQKM